MSVIDKVTVGGTTYDLQDTKAQNDCADLKSALPSIANKFYTIIPDNTDYDTLLTPGTYLCTSSAKAQGMVNKPLGVTLAHKMFVVTTTAPNKLHQIILVNDATASIYKRFYDGSAWRDWKKIANTSDVPTEQVTQNSTDIAQNSTDIANLLASTPSINNTRYTIIPDNTDYDTLTTPGTYLCTSMTHAGTMFNPPVRLAHKLYIITTTGPNIMWQIAFANNQSADIYKRFYNGSVWGDWKKIVSDDNKKYNVLIIGDSYSEQGRWTSALQDYLPINSLVNLGVSSASLKDKRTDRTQYPYTSRPNKNTTSGNLNTFMCQIEKLKRLMVGTDLDDGETQIYTNESEYPNVIIIEGGQNDSSDEDNVVETYPEQFMTIVNDVYVARNSSEAQSAEIGSIYLKTPLETINRTCFAGAYRALVEELQTLFPQAQIFATSRTLLSFWRNANRFPNVTKIKEQQELCCNMCGINFINWQSGTQINTMRNFPKGSGTQADPYLWGEVDGNVSERDTYDLLHPSMLGAKKYAQVVANAIKTQHIDL